jgi:hypothetical protein
MRGDPAAAIASPGRCDAQRCGTVNHRKFQGGPHACVEQMPAVRAPIAFPHYDVRVYVWRVPANRDIPSEC